MRHVGAFLAMMSWGLFSLASPAWAGSGDPFAPLESVRLFGSACNAQVREIADASALFVCEFDGTVDAGLAEMPEFTDDVTASLSVLQRNLAAGTPLERHTVRGVVSGVRLFDGTECLHSGEGAALAFDGKRLNFTCTPGRFALVGPLQTLENTLLAERLVLEETTAGLRATLGEIVPVQAITVDAERTPQ